MSWCVMACVAACTLVGALWSLSDIARSRLQVAGASDGELCPVCMRRFLQNEARVLRRWRPAAVGRCAEIDAQATPTAPILLELLAVCIHSGASIPRALEAVGKAVGGRVGAGLCEASARLMRGVVWGAAWGAAFDAADGGGTDDGRADDDGARAVLRAVAHVLEPSWRHGSSPLPRIETAIEHDERDRTQAIDDGAAKLSTGVLLPMGLCFLPAFVVIGIIPIVAGWGVIALG
ncbi:type II secretion protein F [Pseudoscardovia radai]|uniref:Type II secretion protein F n=1 Tax=Pseudoscardovia radai TaxID=987066 RepID=A0A261EV93_9BIFI|nr:hypothetical protein [Pseudoscardovia radai]OZG50779.1 type II secretion protein F [Pseudoscardovia radai]